jgi:hypothetical protein
VGVDFSVTVSTATASDMLSELRQIVDELGLTDMVGISE